MKPINRIILVILLALGCQHQASAQLSTLARGTFEALIEKVAQKGGQESLEALAKIGGKQAAGEILEKATQEGGEALATKLATYTSKYGIVVLEGAAKSPTKFITALEALAPELRETALLAIRREPFMPEMVSSFGKEALEVAAKHPGVGPTLMRDLGEDGIKAAVSLSREQGIQLARFSKQIAALPPKQGEAMLELIGKSPDKVLGILEKHPKVLTAGTATVLFLASRDQLLGSETVEVLPDGRVIEKRSIGFLERCVNQVFSDFKAPIGGCMEAIGLMIVFWAGIKLWGSYRITRHKVQSAENQQNKA